MTNDDAKPWRLRGCRLQEAYRHAVASALCSDQIYQQVYLLGGVNPAALLGSWPMNEETWLIEANGPLQLSAADLQNKLPFTSHLLKLNSELIQHA